MNITDLIEQFSLADHGDTQQGMPPNDLLTVRYASAPIDNNAADALTESASHVDSAVLAQNPETTHQTTLGFESDLVVAVVHHTYAEDSEWLHVFSYANADDYAAGLVMQTPPDEVRAQN